MFGKKYVLLTIVVLLLLSSCTAAPVAAPQPAAPASPQAPAAPAATEAPTTGAEATQAPAAGGQVQVGLITKTETNPFFVKMKEGADKEAAAKNAKLLSAFGAFDGDNEGQVTAIENMVNAGVKGILITPNVTKAIVPAIQKARDAGVLVIALDTPTEPQDATDALFATDNMKAGQLIGEYAKAAMGGKPAKIAMIDGTPGSSVSQLRHDGFLKGYGIKDGDPQIVCVAAANGDQAKSQTAMENCLSKDPAINLVYTINEPTAYGANTALKAAGQDKNATIVSIDGGCQGVQGVKDGVIAATSQQYPLKMAQLGVDAVVDFATTGKKVSGYTDTGVNLITDKPMTGVDSKDTTFGTDNCWGQVTGAAAAPAPAATKPVTGTQTITATQTVTTSQAPAAGGQVQVGLITKTETNPFFVKMKEGADKEAAAKNAKLLSAFGAFDGDNEGQVTAIENMVNAGVKGILITPNVTKAIVPAIQKARDAGVLVIALDTPTEPQDATDALFATDNMKAGQLIGEYAKAAMGGKPAKIAMIDGTPGSSVSQLRHDGFLKGYGIKDGDPQIVCVAAANGDQAKSQTAMENCLSKDPAINLVYTINEPTAYGANTALKAAGQDKNATIVSIDGGCQGVQGVKDGVIAATSQQYPLKMAQLGVDAVVDFATTGKKVSGYTDTGVNLITDKPMTGVDSKDTTFGTDNCWGTK